MPDSADNHRKKEHQDPRGPGFDVALSNRALSFLAYSLFALLMLGIVWQGARVLSGQIAFSSALVVSCIAAPPMGLAGYLAGRGLRRPAYFAMYLAAVAALLNGVFIQGFGIYAPSMISIVAPCAIAFGLFKIREATLWSLSLLALWGVVFLVNGTGVLQPEVWNQKPPAANLALGLVATFFLSVFWVPSSCMKTGRPCNSPKSPANSCKVHWTFWMKQRSPGVNAKSSWANSLMKSAHPWLRCAMRCP